MTDVSSKKLYTKRSVSPADLAELFDQALTIQVNSLKLDLSGTGSTVAVFVADQAYTLLSAKLAYIEASSADAGVNLSIGKLIVGTDDAQFFVANVASETSKEAGYIKSLTLAATAIATNDIVTVTNAGGKTGTGEVVASLRLSPVVAK